MTKYLSSDPFSSKPATDAYKLGWERTFGKSAQKNPDKTFCDCCDRADEYNGFRSGRLLFVCPKNCACHD